MPAVDSVQSGAETITSGDGTSHTVTITSVDTSRSVVLFTSRNASGFARMLRYLFKAELTNGTTITFTRESSSFAEDVDVEWTVIEFASGELESLQAGTYDAAADPTDVTLGTTLTDAGQAVPIIYYATDANSVTPGLARATFPDTSTLRVDFESAPTSGEHQAAYQVVEFKSADAAIQSGTISVAEDVVSNTATISSVDTGLSFIAHGGMFAPGTTDSNERNRCTLQLTNATTVEHKRSAIGTTLEAQDSAFYVVELPSGGGVEAGEVSIADGNSTPTTQPSFTALTDGKSVLWDSWVLENLRGPESGGTQTGGDSGDALVTAKLDADEAGVTIQRGRSVGDVYYAWHAVDFSAGGGGTTVTGSGTLTAATATLSGTVDVLTSASGTLAAATATLGGAGDVKVSLADALAAATATLSGSGSTLDKVTASGTLQSATATLSGSLDTVVDVSGSLSAAIATLTGELDAVGGATSTMSAADATVSGSGGVKVVASGTLQADTATMFGTETEDVSGFFVFLRTKDVLGQPKTLSQTASDLLSEIGATQTGDNLVDLWHVFFNGEGVPDGGIDDRMFYWLTVTKGVTGNDIGEAYNNWNGRLT